MWICLNVVETKESVDLLNSLLIFLSRENNKKLSIPKNKKLSNSLSKYPRDNHQQSDS